jgi:thiamine biosynthesis lipoprotein
VNRQAGVKPVKVSPETYEVIDRALYFAAISDGAFDPTIFPIMRLWGFGDPKQRVPSKAEIESALPLVDYRKVELNPREGTVFVKEKSMAVDLGAIAKGYAVDRMAAIMREVGVTSFLINAGGNVYAAGLKPDKTPWNVAVTDPRAPQDFLGIVKASDLSVVSSGDYERSFEEGGQRYHHIIDPKTGYPSRTSRGTAALLASSTDADGLSTTLFILGPDRSADVLSKFPGAGAIFVLPDGTIAKRGIVDNFEFK